MTRRRWRIAPIADAAVAPRKVATVDNQNLADITRYPFVVCVLLRGRSSYSAVSLGVSALLGLLSALSRLARRQASVFISASILIGLASAVSVGMAIYLRNLAIDENTRAATHVSFLLATELNHSLQSVSYAVSKVQERLQNATTAVELDSIARGKTLQSALQDQVAQEPLIDRITVLGADGGVVNDSASRPNDGVTVSQRMSQTFMDNLRRGASTDVYISNPSESVAEAPGIGLSKRISFSSGDFLGVVVATLAPSAIDDPSR